jgi:hypothetical protein
MSKPIRLVLYVCLVTALAGAYLSSPTATERPLTEAEGGVPAPAVAPSPPSERYGTKSTFSFTDQDAFLAATWCVTVPTESFEDLEATNQPDQDSIIVPGFTVTTDNPPRLGIWNRRFQDASASDGAQWLGIDENRLIVPQITTFTFNQPINHFGAKFSDYGDFGDSNLMYADDAGTVATAAFSGRPSGNRQFFGIIALHASFTAVRLLHFTPGEFYGVDEVSYCYADHPPYDPIRRPIKRLRPGEP